MTDDRFRSYGILLLRLALGTMFLAHSIVYMLITLTLDGTAKFFVSIGLPAWLAYATFVAEAVGGILLSFWESGRDGWRWRSHPS
jgi:putative oxidoreductase